ncbi:MAG: hypothetical protein K2Y71_12790 [Xanthobacteraceae bacterium]|nr:hypothetical protein [Xanthobacteraceae bacterium]
MSIAFRPLSEADPAQVRELLVRASWQRDWSEPLAENYLAWRYGARGNGDTIVACDKERCVGIIDSFVRPYWIDGREEAVRETCDWFCLPEYRALGVGLHLMRRMMAKPEPILVVGGTDTTQNLLPRLKWARLPDVGNFILGVSARTVAGLMAHSQWPAGVKFARFVPDIRLVRRTRDIAAPSANSEVRVRVLGENEIPSIAHYAIAPALDTRLLDWLACAPAVLGRFVLLSLVCDGEPAGISISRMRELPGFGQTSQIVHVHAADAGMIGWTVGATVDDLIGRGVGAITCRASCPDTAAALSALGFWKRKPSPAFWWPANRVPPNGPLHLSQLQADDALQFT